VIRTSAGALIGLVILAWSSAGAAATPDPTRATGGYTYFNKPGATFAAYEQAFGDCLARAVGAFPDSRVLPGGEVNFGASTAYGGIVGGFMYGIVQNGRMQTDLQNCMTVMGWRVMRLEPSQGAALWNLAPTAIKQQLRDWVGAATPPGEVARTYENDAIRRGAVLFTMPNAFTTPSTNSLSLKAFDATGLKIHPAGVFKSGGDGSKFAAKAVDLAHIATLPASDVTAIVSWSGKPPGMYERPFDFRRFGPTPDIWASDADGRPDDLDLIGKHPTLTVGDRKVYVVAIPPGKWRLFWRGGLEMCLGAPSFEAKPGEVLYLGHFDMDAATQAPDMDVATMTSRIALGPELAAKVRPAPWVNGAQWPCHLLMAAYAVDFPGFPSEPGYRDGP
jgi:hypothetical protein